MRFPVVQSEIVDIIGIWWHEFAVNCAINTRDGPQNYQWDVEIQKTELPFSEKDIWSLRMSCQDDEKQRVSIFTPINFGDAIRRINEQLAEFAREKVSQQS